MNEKATLPDQNALLQGVIDQLIAGNAINAHTKDLLENLDLGDIIEDLTIADANGENAIEVIVAKESTTTLIDQETGDIIA